MFHVWAVSQIPLKNIELLIGVGGKIDCETWNLY